MIFSISEQLTYLSKFFVLNKGDLILTGKTIPFLNFRNQRIIKGTPDGIDFFESGDVLEAKMTDTDCKVLSELKVKVNYDVFDPTYSTKIEALIKPKNCI